MTNQQLIKELESKKLSAILMYRECKGDGMFEVAEDYKKEVQDLAKQINELKALEEESKEIIKQLEDRKLKAILMYRECKGDGMFEVAEDYKKEVQDLAQQIKELKEKYEL